MKRFSILALILLIGLTSCQKAMEEMSQLDFARAFMPPSFRYETVQEPYRGPNDDQPTIMLVTTTLRWNASPNIAGYRLQFSSTDPTFQDLSQVTDLEIQRTYHIIDRPLFGATYYARVMAMAHPGQGNSHWNYLNFQIANEQLFLPLRLRGENQDVFATRARVRWHAYSAADRIELRRIDNENPEGFVLDRTLPISPADNEFWFLNLEFDTEYAVVILEGDQQRGQLNFSTNRGFHDDDPNVIWVQPGNDLQAIMQNPANIGRVIFLPTGFEATIGGTGRIDMPGVMHIFGDADGARPIIRVTGGSATTEFLRLPEVTGGSIIFENVEIIGRGYIVNQGGTASNWALELDTLMFENVVLRDFAQGGVRLQGTGGTMRINYLIFNNTVGSAISTVGNFHVVNTNVAAGIFGHVLITNSTFFDTHQNFINSPAPGTIERVTIENATFDQVVTSQPEPQRFFIDGNNTNIAVVIRNTIFGSTHGELARGIRLSPTSPAIVVENSFRTEDWETGGGDDPAASQFDIPELRVFRGPRSGLTGLFMGPNAGDFRIRPTVTFPGRYTAGDPQWRP